ncbi:hypothetical protein BGX23_010568 [Mortierella sp. AD031]|nr:hypothetical protein BGX23_010568 [Mortierella sp. AD031]
MSVVIPGRYSSLHHPVTTLDEFYGERCEDDATTQSRKDTIEIVAIVLGCVLALYLLYRFFKLQRELRRQVREAEDKAKSSRSIPASDSGGQDEAFEMKMVLDEPEQISDGGGGEGRVAAETMTKMVPMPSFPPKTFITTTITAKAITTTTYEDEVKKLEFAGHPRPNFVTSIGDSEKSRSPQVYTSTISKIP